MEKILPLQENSISQIYLESQETITYQIPVYQRNYAWEEDEITALVKDIYDSFVKKLDKYYIGTLVTFKRGDNNYEVIDGQQRLTTIYIILKVLGYDNLRNKLTYTARKVSAETIKNLPKFGEEYDSGIRNGYSYTRKVIDTIVDKKDIDSFKLYFIHNVRIIHYKVPKDVDLNHYFEVMNSRGEQLEKHEIVKSTLSMYIKDKKELATFSRIWEACSEMNVYIQQSFPEPSIFGNKLSEFNIRQFEDVPEQDVTAGKKSILSLLSLSSEKKDDKPEVIMTDKFQPIIDFPNFLLLVLKLTLYRNYNKKDVNEFTLDDKELLNEFYSALNVVPNKETFAKDIAFNLLFAKYLLDNYIVHHADESKEKSGENPWMLQYYFQEKKNKRYPKNLSDNPDVQKELVHLLSMFEVTFTAKQRKNYLFYCLVHLLNNKELGVEAYLKFLRNLADKYFYDVYLDKNYLNERNQPMPNAFDTVIVNSERLNLDLLEREKPYREIFTEIYPEGKMDIPLFVFNYTDFMLWRKYAREMKGNKTKKGSAQRVQFFKELGCSDFELDAFNTFYFSRTRKSLEHFFPQAKAVKDEIATNDYLGTTQINCFGNFAMIGAEANSSGSNWDPRRKLELYSDTKANPISVASLKFKIMMQRCQDNIQKGMITAELKRSIGTEWNSDDIVDHQEKMLSIICKN